VRNGGEYCANQAIPRDIGSLRELCLKIRQRLITQINNETASGRSIARKVGVDHKTILSFIYDPEKNLSRKVMVKIVSKTTRDVVLREKIKSNEIHPAPNAWN
jgi:hypothetical protein